jgi:hypothetical protein
VFRSGGASRDLGMAAGATLVLFAALYASFVPVFLTNDDVGMAMVAHGYGLAIHGDPNLIFSNVLWGHLVRAIPTLAGVQGYSVATIGSLVTVSLAGLYLLRRAGVDYLVLLLLMLLVLLRPILFPQFTINAGLLTAGATLAVLAYAKQRERSALVIAILLGLGGLLVRQQEALLVMIVALPVLPWRLLLQDRWLQGSLVCWGLLAAAAMALDWQAYQTDAWRFHQAFSDVRVPITDYGASIPLLGRPDLLEAHGLTPSEIGLWRSWFFADVTAEKIAALHAALADLGPLVLQGDPVSRAVAALRTLLRQEVLVLAVTGAGVLLLLPSGRVLLSWLIFLGALAILGALGRPGVLRVYLPILGLLCLLPAMLAQPQQGLRKVLLIVFLVGANAANFWYAVPRAIAGQARIEAVGVDLEALGSRDVFVWGGGFPFEWAYPVLGAPGNGYPGLRLGSLGSMTYAPFAFAGGEEAAGRGVSTRMLSAAGVELVTTDRNIGLLDDYCAERFGRTLQSSKTYDGATFDVYQVRCVDP